MGLLFLFLLGAAWVCDARELANGGGKIVRLTFSILLLFTVMLDEMHRT